MKQPSRDLVRRLEPACCQTSSRMMSSCSPADTFAGQFYHILWWDFDRGGRQYDIATIAGTLCILPLR